MNRALLIIDYTNDFVAEEGTLNCGVAGRSVAGPIVKLTRKFLGNGDYVFVINDIHYPNDTYHPENGLFPPHNLAGTWGRQLYGELESVIEESKKKYAELVLAMDKTRYSAFAGTDLEIRLRERNITELHLAGVCTDICILHTAVDAYNKGFNIVVHKNTVQSFDQAGHQWALRHFKNSLGATIVDE